MFATFSQMSQKKTNDDGDIYMHVSVHMCVRRYREKWVVKVVEC